MQQIADWLEKLGMSDTRSRPPAWTFAGRQVCPVRSASCRIVAYQGTIQHAQPCHRARPLESRYHDRETRGFGD